MDEATDAQPARSHEAKLEYGNRQRGLVAFVSIAAAGVGIQLLSVASGPLVARMLGPDGRGQMVTVSVASVLCSLLGSGGLPSAISHAVAKRGAPARDILRGSLRLWLLMSLIPAVAAAGLATLLLAGTRGRLGLATAAFVITLLSTWFLLLAGMLRGEGNVRHVNALRLSGVISFVGLIVAIFLIHRTDKAAVLLGAYAVAQVIALGVGWFRLERPTGDESVQVSRSEVHRFARRGWVSGVSALDGLGLDHLLVGVLLGQASLGLYAVAASVTNLPLIVLAGVASILLPRMASRSPSESTAMLRRWLIAAIALDLLIVLCLLAVIAPAIRILFGDEFVPSTASARILIVAWALLALRRVLTAAAQAQGKAGRASLIESGCMVILLVGVVLGARLFGIEGAAFAMVTAGAVSCVALAILVSCRTRVVPSSAAAQQGSTH